MIVVDGLDGLPVLTALLGRHRTQGERARAETGGWGDAEPGAPLLAFVREVQRRRGRVDREAGGSLESQGGLARAGPHVPGEDPDLERTGGRRESYRGDLRRDPHRERGHDLHLESALPADERTFVPPDDRLAERRLHAAHAAPGAGHEGGRAPRESLIPGDEQLVAVAVLRPPPVGLRRAGVLRHRHREAGSAHASRGEKAGFPLLASDRPSRGRFEIERVHLGRRARPVEERQPDVEALAGRHQAVVGTSLEDESRGEGE
ncbi:MAG TPA: hypothetical protein VL691_17505, partial [Vicinamibacteria bacterium]|nr:hypothetical protein [Vicinamibacteria bacterium]